MEINAPHNEIKSFVAERFIRTLKNKIYKYMTSVSKNLHVDILDNIVNEYSNTYSTIKMKPVDVKSSKYIYFNVKNNNKDPKFESGDHMRILKY